MKNFSKTKTLQTCIDNANNLQSQLLRAYTDKNLLATLESCSFKDKLNSQTSFVLNHLCELLKHDFISMIWKINYDTDNEANTLTHLNSDICNVKNIDILPIKKLPKKYKHIGKLVKNARHKVISHNSQTQYNNTVPFKIPLEIIDLLIAIYNSICKQHKELSPITNTILVNISISTATGFASLLSQYNESFLLRNITSME